MFLFPQLLISLRYIKSKANVIFELLLGIPAFSFETVFILMLMLANAISFQICAIFVMFFLRFAFEPSLMERLSGTDTRGNAFPEQSERRGHDSVGCPP